MLVTLDGKNITQIPHQREYNTCVSRLTQQELDAIEDELNRRIDGDRIHTAGWMPGSDWTGTVFQPIYKKACKANYERAAMIFGLIVFKVFMDRPETWVFGRFEKDGQDIGSITYFR